MFSFLGVKSFELGPFVFEIFELPLSSVHSFVLYTGILENRRICLLVGEVLLKAVQLSGSSSKVS